GYADYSRNDIRWLADPYFAYLAYRSLLLSDQWSAADVAASQKLIRWHFRTVAQTPNNPVITNQWYADRVGTPAPLPPNVPALDAEDSSTALILDLTRHFVRRGGETSWLLSTGVLAQYETQIQLLDALTDPADGLSWNFRVRTDPNNGGDLRVKYLADACEVFVGRQAMGWLYANVWGDQAKSSEQYMKAELLRNAIQNELYNPTTGIYRLYKFPNGTTGEFDPTQAYPSYLITTPAIYGLIPRESTIAQQQVAAFNGVPAWSNWANDPLSLGGGTQTRTAIMGFSSRISGDLLRAETQKNNLLTNYFPTPPLNQLPTPAYPMIVAEAGWLLLNANYSNLAPTATPRTVSTPVNTAVTVPLTGIDPNTQDSLQFFLTSAPHHGVVTRSGSGWAYRPNPGFAGTDSFTFRSSDGELDSRNALVFLNVTPGVASVLVNPGAVQR
ncbi:MAG: Ig-like domain-containing protein, partial [Gemmataceae bacterium]